MSKSKAVYSIAMSSKDGCMVIVKTVGKSVTVIGSLNRPNSIAFSQGVIDWLPTHETSAEEEAARNINEAVNAELKPRPVYPH